MALTVILLLSAVALGGQQGVVLCAIGMASTFINILAGGGSLLLIPVVTFFTENANITNGTIRLTILVQGVVALYFYRKSGHVDKSTLFSALPVVLGAILGVLFISNQPEQSVRKLLGLAVLVAAFFTVLKKPTTTDTSSHTIPWLIAIPALFASGFYGGVVQAGTGFLFLVTATFWMKMSLAKANVAKVYWAAAYIPLSLFLFHQKSQVDWTMSLFIASGAIPGAMLGTQAALAGGERLIKIAVLISAALGGSYLLATSF